MKIIHLDLLLLIEQEQCLNISGICYIKKIKEKKIEIFFSSSWKCHFQIIIFLCIIKKNRKCLFMCVYETIVV